MAIANDPFTEGVDDALEVAMEYEYIDAGDFLAYNFTWSVTEEGHDYWEAIAEEYR